MVFINPTKFPYIFDINNIYKPKHISDSLWLHHCDVVVCVDDRGVLAVVPRLVRAPGNWFRPEISQFCLKLLILYYIYSYMNLRTEVYKCWLER